MRFGIGTVAMLHWLRKPADEPLAAIPAAVAVMGWIFLRERVAPRTWAAVACAVVGIALFSLSKPEHSAHAAQALDAKNT